MIFPQDQQVKSFFFGQYFTNSLKITLGILVPSLIFAFFDNLNLGIIISLGAFYVSISDHPGPVLHRRNGMLATILFIFFTVIVTGLINQNTWLIAIEIFIFCFLFSMLTIYGARASAVGTATLLMMISTIYIDSMGISLLRYALLTISGGIWYMLLSLSLNQIRPYRQAQQYLGESILEVAKYIRLKADFYDNKTSVQDLYKKLVIQQIVVNEHQDNVRQIILRTREKVKETMKSGRLVMMIFIDIIESFELAMSTQQNYTKLRAEFSNNAILPEFRKLIYKIAKEFDDLGYALINNEKPRPLVSFDEDLIMIKERLNVLESQGISVITLKKTLINIRNLARLLGDMYNYFLVEKLTFLSKTDEADLTKFISHQDFDWKTFKNNLSLQGVVFRHSVRLALSCLGGYLIIQSLPFGQYSYWILVTIIVIQKPDFVISKKRNYERVIGSVIGGLIGALILLWIHDEFIRLMVLVIFMILSFSFNRVKYLIGVIFMTALILILFSLVSHTNNMDLTVKRISYTVIGSAIAFLASYFILPSWESSQIKTHMSNILKANLLYFKEVISRFNNKALPSTDYKLSRKNVLMQTANLGSAFQRMLSEPKNKQENMAYINQFVVLNHILSSYLASLSSDLEEIPAQEMSYEHLKLIKKTNYLLREAISHFEDEPFEINLELPDIPKETSAENSDLLFVQKQLMLINKISADLVKLNKTHMIDPDT